MEVALVYILTALAGAGLYCLLPRTGDVSIRARWAGRIIGAAAMAALLVYLASRFGGAKGVNGFFYTFAVIAIVAAARVVTHTKPAYCVMYFILVVTAVAAMLLLLAAEFLAIALIIIYGGAIIVTYVFVIMLAQQAGTTLYDRSAREPLAAVFAGFLVAGTVAAQIADPRAFADVQVRTSDDAAEEAVGNTAAIGEALLTDYVITLEVAGVLLLAAMVGGILLARRPLPEDVTRRGDGEPPGKAGREAAPF